MSHPDNLHTVFRHFWKNTKKNVETTVLRTDLQGIFVKLFVTDGFKRIIKIMYEDIEYTPIFRVG